MKNIIILILITTILFITGCSGNDDTKTATASKNANNQEKQNQVEKTQEQEQPPTFFPWEGNLQFDWVNYMKDDNILVNTIHTESHTYIFTKKRLEDQMLLTVYDNNNNSPVVMEKPFSVPIVDAYSNLSLPWINIKTATPDKLLSYIERAGERGGDSLQEIIHIEGNEVIRKFEVATGIEVIDSFKLNPSGEISDYKLLHIYSDLQSNAGIAKSSDGPLLVVAENNQIGYQSLIEATENQKLELKILENPHDILDPLNVLLIEEKGNFAIIEQSHGNLIKVALDTGEPLYDGANDKVIETFSRYAIYPHDEKSFLMMSLNSGDLKAIDSNLEVLDEGEFEHTDEGTVEARIDFHGQNLFTVSDILMYQRQQYIRVGTIEFGQKGTEE